jgi:predicted nucleotidyltransferase
MAGLQTIDKRSKVPKEAIQEVVEQIKSKFRPKKIILFGSYAYGTPRPESDVDLLVVMPLKKNLRNRLLKFCKIQSIISVWKLLLRVQKN